MALWDIVLSGSEFDDRSNIKVIENSNTSLFETLFICTIEANGEVEGVPNIIAKVFPPYLCVAIDGALNVFSNVYCRDIVFYSKFETNVDLLHIFRDLLFVGLRNGMLYILHLPSGGLQVRNEFIEKNEDLEKPIFVEIIVKEDAKNRTTVFIFTSIGRVYSLDLPIEEINSFFENFNESTLSESFVQNFNFNKELIIHLRISILSVYKVDENDLLISSKKSLQNINFENLSTKNCDRISFEMQYEYGLDNVHFIKIQEVKSSEICIGLSNTGQLFALNSQVGILTPIWTEEALINFSVIENLDDLLDDVHLLLLTENQIILLSFPDLNIIFKRCVTGVFLVDFGKSLENILFIESEHSNSQINKLIIKSISESSVEMRYRRLVQNCEFEVAENFAKKYHLNITLVHKAKVEYFMEKINIDFDETLMNNLIENFDLITNVSFIVECCKLIAEKSFFYIEPLFEYTLQRIESDYSSDLSDENSFLISTCLKLDVYKIIKMYESYDLLENWPIFYKADIFHVLQHFLEKENFNTAALIWSRFQYFLLAKDSTYYVTLLLESIPKCSTLNNILQWFRFFLPTILQDNKSETLSIIMQYIIDKMYVFEKCSPNAWPTAALEFAEEILKILNKNSQIVTKDTINHLYVANGPILQYFFRIIQCLEELSILKENHQVVIPLEIYVKHERETLAAEIIDQVSPDKIDFLMENFLEHYLLGIDSDVIFQKYISSITSDYSNWWACTGVAPWERPVINLLKHIHSSEIRLLCLNQILKMAPVPWTERLNNILYSELRHQHPLVDELKNQVKMADLKLMSKKYNFKVSDLSKNIQQTQLVKRIIKFGKIDEIIADVEKVINSYKSIPADNYQAFLCLHFIKLKQFDRLMEYLDKLSNRIELCGQLVEIYEQELQKKRQTLLKASLHEFLTAITNKWSSENWQVNKNRIRKLDAIYQLKNKYDIFITPAQYVNEVNRRASFEEYFEKRMNQDVQNLEYTCFEIMLISDLLLLSEEISLLKLVDSINDIKSIIIVSNYILNNLTNRNQVTKLCATLTMKLLTYDIEKDSLYISTSDLFELVNLMFNFMSIASTRQISMESLYLIRWIKLFYDLTQLHSPVRTDPLYRYSFTPIYKDNPTSPTVQIAYNNLREFFLILFKIAKFCPNLKLLHTYSIDDTEEGLETHFKKLRRYLKELVANQYDLITYQMVVLICEFYSFLDLTQLPERVKYFIEKSVPWLQPCKKMLLDKVAYGNVADFPLVISCISNWSNETVVEWINTNLKKFSNDISKFIFVCREGICYTKLHDLPDDSLRQNLLRATWAQKLAQLGDISIKTVFKSDPQLLLNRIIRSHNMCIDTVLEFSKDFHFNTQQTLFDTLKYLLINWEPEIECSESKIKINNSNKLFEQCDLIVAKIETKELLIGALLEIFNAANSYFYEIFIWILDCLKKFNYQYTNSDTYLSILNVLLTYTRFETPSSNELAKDWEVDALNNSVSEIVNYRLPFSYFRNLNNDYIFKSVRSEFNVNTCEFWISIAYVLNFNTDFIYMYSIKQTVGSKLWNQEFFSRGWSLHSINGDLLHRLTELAYKIVNSVISVGALYYVIQNTPAGKDRLIISELCYKLAQDKSLSENVCLSKVENSYRGNYCNHILYSNGLEDLRQYISLSDPKQLLTKLYEHSSIIERTTLAVQRPDINSTANDIAKIFDIDINKFRLELIEVLLQKDDEHSMLNMENSFVPSTKVVDDSINIDDNLLRICYILNSSNIFDAVCYLINKAIDQDIRPNENTSFTNFDLTFSGFETNCSSVINNRSRYKALKCLIYLADPETIENVTGMQWDEIHSHLRILWHLVQFEKLGMSYNITRLQTCNKLELVKGLYSTFLERNDAFSLISSLMLEYNIRDKQMWQLVLQKMIQFQMIKELRQLLPQLISCTLLLATSVYTEAWQKVVEQQFSDISCPLSISDFDYVNALIFLMTCPILSKLNILNIVEHCLTIKKYNIAAALLPFISSCDERNDVSVKILKQYNSKSDLYKSIEELEDLGISTTKQAIKILNSAANKK